jgi:hypothetical protein
MVYIFSFHIPLLLFFIKRYFIYFLFFSKAIYFPQKEKNKKGKKNGTKKFFEFFLNLNLNFCGKGKRRKSLDFFCFLNVATLATSI